MRKNIKKSFLTPLPVLMIGTYDEEGRANIMNAAWGGQYDFNQIYISLSEHKTTDNLRLKGEFTVSFATVDTVVASDYFGVVSGKEQDKVQKANFHVVKSEFVDAPLFEEYPLTLECKVVSFENGDLIGQVVNMSADESILDENGNVDLGKLKPIMFDAAQNKYRAIGEVVGNAFSDGFALK